jgi:uncharacterized protein (DUF433 family)
MMSAAIEYPHISVDAQGVARLGGTRYKVAHLAGEHYHYGWSAEEILRQHPDLRPEQVYAALVYFYDHYDAMVEAMRKADDDIDAQRWRQTLTRNELMARTNRPARPS